VLARPESILRLGRRRLLGPPTGGSTAGGTVTEDRAADRPLVREIAAFLGRRRHLLVRPERVTAALARWDEMEAAARLPAGLRRPVRRPVLPRSSLEGLRAMLLEELGRLEGGPAGG
jgi:hypothetical protein